MRQGRDQVGARAILIANIGDVLQNQQRAERDALGMVKRDRLQYVGMLAAADVKIDFDAVAVVVGRGPLDSAQGVANAEIMGMVAAEIVERTAERIGGIDAENQRRDFIDMRDDAVGVD